MMLATLLAVVVMAAPPPPSPDPDTSACYAGWCPVPTTTHPVYITTPLSGLAGMWRCRITRSPMMRCVRVG
jgi:hypothetical protein